MFTGVCAALTDGSGSQLLHRAAVTNLFEHLDELPSLFVIAATVSRSLMSDIPCGMSATIELFSLPVGVVCNAGADWPIIMPLAMTRCGR
ncbi:MAG: hypothetical protein ACI9OJ_001056 [Myxococcota bacterium]|jgi:hypothetical protein